jgi:hypothetical protein
MGIVAKKTINVSRLLLTNSVGQAAWSVLLSVLHQAPESQRSNTYIEKGEYIVKVDSVPSETITREYDWRDIPLCTLHSEKTKVYCLHSHHSCNFYGTALCDKCSTGVYIWQPVLSWQVAEIQGMCQNCDGHRLAPLE